MSFEQAEKNKQRESHQPRHTPDIAKALPADVRTGVTIALEGLGPDLDRLLVEMDVDHDTPEHRAAAIRAASRELQDVGEMGVAALAYAARPEERTKMKQLAERAAPRVNKLVRFVRTRTPHKQLEAELMTGVHAFDTLLEKLGTLPIESRDAAVLSEHAQRAGEVEATAVSAAVQRVRIALIGLKDREHNAVDTFAQLAPLQDQEPPPFIEQLLKALFWAAVDKMTAGFLEMVIAHAGASSVKVDAPATGGSTGAKKEMSPLGKLLSKMVTTTSGTAIKAAEKHSASSQVDPKLRALAYFAGHLSNSIDDRFIAYEQSLVALAHDGETSEADLLAMEKALDASRKNLYERHLTDITKAWSTYLLRAHLSSQFAGSTKVSDMHDYFGKQRGDGRAFGTDKSGGDGILSVLFMVDEPGGRPRLEPSATKVVGMNSVLKNIILSDAEHDLARVELPKEINVQCRNARATIALDERNRIRDVRNWNDVEGVLGETAHAFWSRFSGGLEVR